MLAKKFLRGGLVVLSSIGALVVSMFVFEFGLVIFKPYGVLNAGEFRGIEIGMPRYEVADLLSENARLKIIGYEFTNAAPCYIGIEVDKVDDSCSKISGADAYILSYWSGFQEQINVVFENDEVVKIEFRRHVVYLDP